MLLLTIAIHSGEPLATEKLHLGDGKIYYRLENDCRVTLSLFSECGKLLRELGGFAHSGKMSLGELANGTYILAVTSPELSTKLTFSLSD